MKYSTDIEDMVDWVIIEEQNNLGDGFDYDGRAPSLEEAIKRMKRNPRLYKYCRVVNRDGVVLYNPNNIKSSPVGGVSALVRIKASDEFVFVARNKDELLGYIHSGDVHVPVLIDAKKAWNYWKYYMPAEIDDEFEATDGTVFKLTANMNWQEHKQED